MWFLFYSLGLFSVLKDQVICIFCALNAELIAGFHAKSSTQISIKNVWESVCVFFGSIGNSKVLKTYQTSKCVCS